MDLSIIIPGCNEWPQNAFTIQAVRDNIGDRLEYEIIYVENGDYKPENLQTVTDAANHVIPQGVGANRKDGLWAKFTDEQRLAVLQYLALWQQVTPQNIPNVPNVRYREYRDNLSHWQAKNAGVRLARGDVLLFLDAHVLPSRGSIPSMYQYFMANQEELHGTLHLPVMYMNDKDGRELIYALVYKPKVGEFTYRFTRLKTRDAVHTVPCMSTCGMMISKHLLKTVLGGWPKTIGIYSGGEQFINGALAVTGHKVNIWPFGRLYHYAYHRLYHFNYDDLTKNRLTAAYVALGEEWMRAYQRNRKGDSSVILGCANHVLRENKEHRALIEASTIITPEEWAAQQPEEYVVKERPDE